MSRIQLRGVAAAAAVSGALLIAALPASAASGHGATDPPEMAFQANTGTLWEACACSVSGNLSQFNTGLAMAAGTSPAIAPTSTTAGQGAYEAAFHGSNGDLWTTGTYGTKDTGLGMMAGTSPAIADTGPDSAGYYAIAFQANTGDLWTVTITPTTNTGQPAVTAKDLGLPMAAGTSPAITPQPSLGYEVAYQANTGSLAVAGTDGTGILNLGMKAGTNPSIAQVTGGYQIAFQANTGDLWTAGTLGSKDLNLGMDNSTSPSIAMTGDTIGSAPQLGDDYEIAFQANTGDLWTTGNGGLPGGNLGQPMKAGTSPAIRGTIGLTIATASQPSTLSAGYSVAYQASAGSLSFYDEISGQAFSTGLGMDNSTSPGSGGGYGEDANP